MLPITGVNMIIFLFLLETVVWNHFEFGPAVLEKNLKFWILSNGGHFVQLGDTFWAILVESITRNICMKLFWNGACCLKCSFTEISHLLWTKGQDLVMTFCHFQLKWAGNSFLIFLVFKLLWPDEILSSIEHDIFFITFYNFGPDNKFFCSEFGYEII